VTTPTFPDFFPILICARSDFIGDARCQKVWSDDGGRGSLGLGATIKRLGSRAFREEVGKSPWSRIP